MADYSTIKILVVDDEPAILEIMSTFLEDYGFNVFTAQSGEEALELIKENEYNICVVDLTLPGINGEDLIVNARALQPEQRHIIYTGMITYNLPEKLTQLGMRPEHVFFKPIRVFSLLVKCIKELAAEQEQLS